MGCGWDVWASDRLAYCRQPASPCCLLPLLAGAPLAPSTPSTRLTPALAALRSLSCGCPRVRPLRWYIMTSPATDAETKKHFRANGFFGLKESQVGQW